LGDEGGVFLGCRVASFGYGSVESLEGPRLVVEGYWDAVGFEAL
jgi:hypothetical protein